MYVNNAVAEIIITVAPEQVQTTETMKLNHICKVTFSNSATERV
jgi:hypothetical protein